MTEEDNPDPEIPPAHKLGVRTGKSTRISFPNPKRMSDEDDLYLTETDYERIQEHYKAVKYLEYMMGKQMLRYNLGEILIAYAKSHMLDDITPLAEQFNDMTDEERDKEELENMLE